MAFGLPPVTAVPDQDFSGPLLVTLVYTVLFDVLMIHQARAPNP